MYIEDLKIKGDEKKQSQGVFGNSNFREVISKKNLIRIDQFKIMPTNQSEKQLISEKIKQIERKLKLRKSSMSKSQTA